MSRMPIVLSITTPAQVIANGLGGVGAFHINEDHIYGPNYGNIRGAISLMNPPMIPEKNLK